MNHKTAIFLVISIIFLAILLINRSNERSSVFLSRSYEDIDGFSISSRDGEFHIKKSADGWFFSDGIRADNKAVSVFLSALTSAFAGNPLCEKNDCLKNFSLDEKAPAVTLISGSQKTALRIGKNSPSPFSSYIMDVSSGKVMELSGFCASMLPKKADLIEKAPFRFKSPEKIRIIKPGAETDFWLEEGEWFSVYKGLKKNFSHEINEAMKSVSMRVSEDEKQLKERKLIMFYKAQLPEEFYYKCQRDKILLKTALNPAYTFELPKKNADILCQ